MGTDEDMKIAGDKPSEAVRRNGRLSAPSTTPDSGAVRRAKAIGRKLAERFLTESASNPEGTNDAEMLLQKRLLLSFTVTVGLEAIPDDAMAGVAQKHFLDTLRAKDPEIYRTSSDTGAFSFYYLAYRRGSEVERRIGQTFAMLCSHDGDPIFQELGEALYCWFSSEVQKAIQSEWNE